MSKMTRDEYLREFDLMVEQISCKDEVGDGAGYGALCRIADSFIRPYVERLSYKYTVLRQLDVVSDVYHDILVTLIKSCVDKFLYRDDKLNNDAEGFLRWIYTVARNTVNDNVKFYLSKAGHETPLVTEEGDLIDIPTEENPLSSLEARETLEECLRAVVEQDSALYITFTWILRAIVLSKCDLSSYGDGEEYGCVEAKVNGIVVETFGELTMSEIYAVILLESQFVPWMNFTEADKRSFSERLAERIGEQTLGDMKYCRFFMKKGGKATVSDWVNRVNSRILKSVYSVF